MSDVFDPVFVRSLLTDHGKAQTMLLAQMRLDARAVEAIRSVGSPGRVDPVDPLEVLGKQKVCGQDERYARVP